MKTITAVLVLFTSVFSFAGYSQVVCGTPIPDAQWTQAFNDLVQSHASNGKSQAPVYTIPVIVHVIHGGQAPGNYPNLANAQIVAQIQSLNHDYAGLGFNNWNYPASAYTQWATTQSLSPSNTDGLGRVKIADCSIQFCLATLDTLGNPLAEPGVDRINYV